MQWKDFVAFMFIHWVNAERCTCPTYSMYATCDSFLLWHIEKVPSFKVLTLDYEWIAQRPFKLGCGERLVAARAESTKQSL